MEYNLQINRDKSIEVKCIKCLIPIARIEVTSVFRIGFYICERCFARLDQPLPKLKPQEEVISL